MQKFKHKFIKNTIDNHSCWFRWHSQNYCQL